MFPELLHAGPFVVRTLSVATGLAFCIISFLFWRKGREEHYELAELFDTYFVAWIVGFVVARASYVALHQEMFGFSVGKWFDIVTYPGFHGLVCLVVAGVYLFWQARSQEWDAHEVLDFFSLAIAHGLVVVYVGQFLDGTGMGTATQLPIGIVFPGVQGAHHPVQLYLAVVFLIIARTLARVEYRYRTYEWYRSGKKTAQTGFLVSVFLLSTGAALFTASFFRTAVYSVGGIGLDALIAGVLFGVGAWMLFSRSGRGLQKKTTSYEAAA